jgi:acetylornithine deacetylase/succinyl-diaminopimelate desuccinylase-like protein
VPPGEGWTSAPFAPERAPRGELLYGRGAVDMKGAIAAMVAAVREIPADAGTLSFIITGDEEGPAKYGTLALIDHMRAVGEMPDLCLVGEPTSTHRLGDMMKIGRRGSVNIWLEVEGAKATSPIRTWPTIRRPGWWRCWPSSTRWCWTKGPTGSSPRTSRSPTSPSAIRPPT